MTMIDLKEDIPWIKALSRGFKRRCPCCGQGVLFKAYLTLAETCEACRLDYTKIRSADDGPAYMTMSVVLFLFAPLFLWIDIRYEISYLELLFVFLPLTILITLGLLPLIKGAFVAASWKAHLEKEDQ